MKIRKPLATKASLNEILVGIVTNMYDFDEASQLRIVSTAKPNFTILCVEADISDAIVSFLDPDNQSSDVRALPKDTVFESTVYDFIAVATGPDGLTSISLHELILMNGLIERGAGDDDLGSTNTVAWSMEAQEWDMWELVTKEQLTQKEDETPTDMHQFG
jgi:hypothetical protein